MKEEVAVAMEAKKKGKPEWLEKAEVKAELKAGNKVSDKEEKKVGLKESTEVDRLMELTGRLNRAETKQVSENREVDQIRALSKLLG